jgi:hypothetical protein
MKIVAQKMLPRQGLVARGRSFQAAILSHLSGLPEDGHPSGLRQVVMAG